MSKIAIEMHTDRDNGDISISMKSECTVNELEAAVGYLMAGLVSTTSMETIDRMIEDLKADIKELD